MNTIPNAIPHTDLDVNFYSGLLPGSSPLEIQPAPPLPQLCRLADLLGAWQDEAAAAHQARRNKQPRGPLTGLAKLDKALNGCLAPGLHILHGQPGAGKSALALQIAAECGCAALYVTCEMAPLELLRRHTARVTGTYLSRLKSGELEPASSLELAQQAVGQAPGLFFVDATRAYASPLFLRDCALIVRGEEYTEGHHQGHQQRHPTERHLLLIVDSLHSWAEGANTVASEYETLNAGICALRTLAHQLNGPILAVCERNRDNMKNGGLSAGAGTRKIEYGAETVIQLRRGTDEREDAGGEVAIDISLEKNRHGASGKVAEVMFHGALQRFRET